MKSWLYVYDTLTLTCTVQNSTGKNIELTWLSGSDPESETDENTDELKVENLLNVTTDSFEYSLKPSAGNSKGTFYCKANDILSNKLTLFFRDLAINQIPSAEQVYKDQVVDVQILHFGDANSLTCNKSEPLETVNQYESKLSFKVDSSYMLNCSSTYSDDYILKKSLLIEVLGESLFLFLYAYNKFQVVCKLSITSSQPNDQNCEPEMTIVL